MERKKDKATLTEEMKVYENWRKRAINRVPKINKEVELITFSGLLTIQEQSALLIKWSKCQYRLFNLNKNIIEYWAI